MTDKSSYYKFNKNLEIKSITIQEFKLQLIINKVCIFLMLQKILQIQNLIIKLKAKQNQLVYKMVCMNIGNIMILESLGINLDMEC